MIGVFGRVERTQIINTFVENKCLPWFCKKATALQVSGLPAKKASRLAWRWNLPSCCCCAASAYCCCVKTAIGCCLSNCCERKIKRQCRLHILGDYVYFISCSFPSFWHFIDANSWRKFALEAILALDTLQLRCKPQSVHNCKHFLECVKSISTLNAETMAGWYAWGLPVAGCSPCWRWGSPWKARTGWGNRTTWGQFLLAQIAERQDEVLTPALLTAADAVPGTISRINVN